MKRLAYVGLIVTILVLVFYFPTAERSLEEIQARVLSKGEVDNFNLAGAAAGYLVGRYVNKNYGLPSALIGGIGTSKGCHVPLMIEGKPQTIFAPHRACRELKENDHVVVRKSTTVRKDNGSEIFYQSVSYSLIYN